MPDLITSLAHLAVALTLFVAIATVCAVVLVVLAAVALALESTVNVAVVGEIVEVKRDEPMTFADAPPGAEPTLIVRELRLVVDSRLFEQWKNTFYPCIAYCPRFPFAVCAIY
jgi:hypothetical protein